MASFDHSIDPLPACFSLRVTCKTPLIEFGAVKSSCLCAKKQAFWCDIVILEARLGYPELDSTSLILQNLIFSVELIKFLTGLEEGSCGIFVLCF